jgi:hypothetical protein
MTKSYPSSSRKPCGFSGGLSTAASVNRGGRWPNALQSGITIFSPQLAQRPSRPAAADRTEISWPHFGQKNMIGI